MEHTVGPAVAYTSARMSHNTRQEDASSEEIWYAAWSNEHRREYFWTTVETVDSNGNVVTSTSKTQWLLPTTQGFYGQPSCKLSSIDSRNDHCEDRILSYDYHTDATSSIDIRQGRNSVRKNRHVRINLSRRRINLIILLIAIPAAQHYRINNILSDARGWFFRQLTVDNNGIDEDTHEIVKKTIKEDTKENSINQTIISLEEILDIESNFERKPMKNKEDLNSVTNQVNKELEISLDSVEKESFDDFFETIDSRKSIISTVIDGPSIAFYANSRSRRQIDAYASLSKARLSGHNIDITQQQLKQKELNVENGINTENEDSSASTNSSELLLTAHDEFLCDDGSPSVGKSASNNLPSHQTAKLCYFPFTYLFSKPCRKVPPFQNLESLISTSTIQ